MIGNAENEYLNTAKNFHGNSVILKSDTRCDGFKNMTNN